MVAARLAFLVVGGTGSGKTTLLNGLQTVDGTFGLETMCVGGGQGMAMVIERLS